MKKKKNTLASNIQNRFMVRAPNFRMVSKCLYARKKERKYFCWQTIIPFVLCEVKTKVLRNRQSVCVNTTIKSVVDLFFESIYFIVMNVNIRADLIAMYIGPEIKVTI